MITITTNQALERWDELPENIREALYSEANSDFLWKTCEDEHIPDEKIYTISKIAGWVLMGFLRPDDVASEIVDELSIDKRIASVIVAALNERIFVPLKADIDKAYKPLSKVELAPKIIQSAEPIAAPAAVSIPMPAAKLATVPVPPAPAKIIPQAVTVKSASAISFTAKATPGSLTAPPPVPPVKPKLSETGWSRLGSEAPTIKLSETKPTQVPAPAGSVSTNLPPKNQTSPVAAAAQRGPEAARRPVGEFERRAMQSGNVPPSAPFMTGAGWATKTPTVPIPAAPASEKAKLETQKDEPAPVIIHEDAAFKVQGKSPDFRIKLPIESLNVQRSPNSSTIKPAVLELGKSIPPVPIPPTSTSTLHTVHYADFGATPVPRKITEIGAVPAAPAMPVPPVASVPMPPPPLPPVPKPASATSAPAMPPPPMPPLPPQAPKQTATVIKKDYV